MSQVSDDLKRYDELLIDEEKTILIKYIKEKIEFLKKDLEVLRQEFSTYTRIIKRFLDEETVDKFVKRIIKDYKYQIESENDDLLLVINGTDEKIEKRVKNPTVKSKIKDARKSLMNLYGNKKFILDFKAETDEDEEDEKKQNKQELLDCCLYDLNYAKTNEYLDINYYKRLIEKIENNGNVSCSDGQELWCMCDNKESDGVHNDLHTPIIQKLKEYTAKLNEEEDEKEDE